MKISVSIMAHPKREEQAESLFAKLVTMPFDNTTLVYDNGMGELYNGDRALIRHTGDWHLVLQDDAIIGDNFYTNLMSALENAPDQTIISLYTGKVRPFPTAVTTAVTKAQEEGASWLSHQTLLWGVGIAIKTDLIPAVLLKAKHSNLPYDRRIGQYFKDSRQKVYYTIPSIVDHNNTLPSLTGHGYAKEPRVAHMYSDEILNFNNKVIGI